MGKRVYRPLLPYIWGEEKLPTMALTLDWGDSWFAAKSRRISAAECDV